MEGDGFRGASFDGSIRPLKTTLLNRVDVHRSRQLRPVNRIEPSIFTTDWHVLSRLAMLASHLGLVASLEIVL